MRRIALGLILATSLSLPGLAAEPDGPAALISRTEAVRIAVQGQLSHTPARREAEKVALLDYYSIPDQPLLWTDENGVSPRGKAAMAEIAKADDYGLQASDYTLPQADGFNPADAKAAEWLADAELKISYAVLGYARDARGGRFDPQRLSKNLDPTLALPNPSEVLGVVSIRSDPAAYLRSFQPDQPQFEALRQKLIEARGGKTAPAAPKPDVVIVPEGPVLKLGFAHGQVALLRKRLNIATAPGGDEYMFDRDVLAAVKEFQTANGANPDGMVGLGTRRLLNGQQQPEREAGAPKIQTILINMERWRWLPNDLGPFYVTVNIPEFMLRVVEDGKPVHETRVVTGKPDKQTPVISDEMEEVVFNPYWNVPNSIKNEEIAPFFGGGGGFFGGWDTSILKRHNLRVKYGSRIMDPDTVDWSRYDLRNFDLVQPPGPGNVLGQVKFVFPNSHDVYMHDTTQKNLFANTVRAESHGCMRVQNPDRLAALLLKHDQDWSPAQVASAIQGTDDNHIALEQKIPVYITYFTLRVNDDGSISTFRDIYGHDARMAAALSGKALPYDLPGSEEVVASQVKPRFKRRQDEAFNDFTRALFGF